MVNLGGVLGDVGEDFGDDELKELFSQFGTITSCKVVKDPKVENGEAVGEEDSENKSPSPDNKNKGFGFVCFEESSCRCSRR